MERPSDLPEFETRPTIRIDQSMPEKGSVIALSDAAFRLFIEAICYCGRGETDGLIPKAVAARMSSKRAAVKELLDRGHLIEADSETWALPDYLRWNRSSSEIDSFRASKSESGAKGAHMRWHVPSRRLVPGCDFCYPEAMADE